MKKNKCIDCGKELKWKTPKRCRSCYFIYNRESKGKKRIKTNCSFCKKELFIIPYRIKKHKNFFCSKEHFYLWKKENVKGDKNPMFGRHQSEKCKEINKKLHLGNNHAKGIKRPDLSIANRNRRGIPIKEEQKNKQRISILKYWNSEEGKKQKLITSGINKKWTKEHPNQIRENAKQGHKACPRISSSEKKIYEILNKLNIKFVPQFEYKLGFADIFIKPNKIIFVNGNYWHNYPYGTEKDKKQIEYLKKYGYDILVIWGSELENKNLVNRILEFNKKENKHEHRIAK